MSAAYDHLLAAATSMGKGPEFEALFNQILQNNLSNPVYADVPPDVVHDVTVALVLDIWNT